MQLNAEMNTVMTERFHVAGALLVKLFGRIDREVDVFHDRASQVADLGVRTAIHGRALFASLGFVGASATGWSTSSEATWSSATRPSRSARWSRWRCTSPSCTAHWHSCPTPAST
jgi:hypothetical protein